MTISCQVKFIRINIRIKHLSWDWPWLNSLHACLDQHRCRRSRSRWSRHDRHPKLVNVHDVERVTDSSSRAARHGHCAIVSSTSSASRRCCRRRHHHVDAELVTASWHYEQYNSWNCDIVKASKVHGLKFEIDIPL